MKVFEDRKVSFHVEPHEAEDVRFFWGGQKRRVRMQPHYVVIDWRREDGGEWVLWEVWVSGPRIHAQSNSSISRSFYRHRGDQHELPDWLADLVELSRPGVAAAVCP